MARQGKGLLAVWTDIPVHIEADFNRWYDEEHLAERAGIPGFLNARRYVSVQGTRNICALRYRRCSGAPERPLPQGPEQCLSLDTAYPSALQNFVRTSMN